MMVSMKTVWILLYQASIALGISFRYGPQSASVFQGDMVVLECAVDDKGPGNFVFWQHVSSNMFLSSDDKILSAVEDNRFAIGGNHELGQYNLMISNVDAPDDGMYRCGFQLVDNDGSVFVFREANLTVLIPPHDFYPRCTLSTENPNPQPGDTVSVACVSIGSSPPTELTWRRNGSILSSDINAAFVVLELVAEDNGVEFVCKASGKALFQPRFCSVTPMIILPVVFITSMNPEPTVGDSITLTCNVQNAVPSYNELQWFVDGKQITGVTGNTQYFVVGTNENILIIPQSQRSDDGRNVTCIARTPSGLAGRSTLVLSLQGIETASKVHSTVKPQTRLGYTTEITAPANMTSSFDSIMNEPITSVETLPTARTTKAQRGRTTKHVNQNVSTTAVNYIFTSSVRDVKSSTEKTSKDAMTTELKKRTIVLASPPLGDDSQLKKDDVVGAVTVILVTVGGCIFLLISLVICLLRRSQRLEPKKSKKPEPPEVESNKHQHVMHTNPLYILNNEGLRRQSRK
ncbi:muscle M-line assembly protein unc-89-like [Anneissia japonica]|uniref:muscle M-line assembly protein unc-89-like n=1 Tax=Anneissia japonica TaxID=1529436 RepID=UPI0014256184|nr:muscle M-line assembly protein unc-89-like [Anneissia japonica]